MAVELDNLNASTVSPDFNSDAGRKFFSPSTHTKCSAVILKSRLPATLTRSTALVPVFPDVETRRHPARVRTSSPDFTSTIGISPRCVNTSVSPVQQVYLTSSCVAATTAHSV